MTAREIARLRRAGVSVSGVSDIGPAPESGATGTHDGVAAILDASEATT